MTGRVLEAGDVVADRYRIDATLGSGGMGAVYRGFDLGIRRPVAIKVLAPQLRGHQTPNQRMEREAFATARVSHQNCVTVLDCGSLEDGSVFLAMELLEGRDLAAELRRGRLDPLRAIDIAIQVLRGLAHAHEAGVIHRDIKPANIYLVGGDDDPDFAKLLDFGIAKLVGDAREEAGAITLTQEGLAIGSPVYMSPEQAIGNPLDARSDLYSVAVVLFEMLTGRPPFDDEDKIAVLRMHLAKPPPALTEVAPDLAPPLGLESLLLRCLAKEPDARLQSARELIEALEVVAGRQRVPTGRPTPTPMPAVAPPPSLGTEPTLASPMAGGTPTPIPSQLVVPPQMAPAASPAKRWAIIGAAVLGLCGVLAVALSGGDGDKPESAAKDSAGGAPAVAAKTGDGAEGERTAEPDDLGHLEDGDGEDGDGGDSDDGDSGDEIAPASGGDDALVDPLATRIAEIDRMRRAGSLYAAQKRGRALVKQHPKSAALRLAYGHVFMDRMWWSDGFEQYTAAIALDPELRRDPAVIDNAVRGLSSRSKPWLAERFIRDQLGEVAIEALERAASSRSRNLSSRAKRLLRRLKR